MNNGKRKHQQTSIAALKILFCLKSNLAPREKQQNVETSRKLRVGEGEVLVSGELMVVRTGILTFVKLSKLMKRYCLDVKLSV